MQWIPKNNQQVIIRLILVTGLGAVGLLGLLPSPSGNETWLNDEVTWTLPVLTNAAEPQQAYTRLQKRQPWYELGHKPKSKQTIPTEQPEPKTKPRQWQFVGTSQQGQQLYMLVLDNQGKSLSSRYKVGDRLPDDSTIMAIAHDYVLVEKANSEEKITLYPTDKK